MDNKEEKQSQLLAINVLCSCLIAAIEKHYNTPDHFELLVLMKELAEKCREYLKVYPP